MIKLLIVDDSALIRKVLSDVVKDDKEIKVVGMAKDGLESIAMIEALKPDVVTLDIEMPKLDGLGVLKELDKRKIRVPVVMISSLTSEGARQTMTALDLGAVDFLPKPSNFFSLSHNEQKQEIISKIKAAANAKKFFNTQQKVQKSYNIVEKQANKYVKDTDSNLDNRSTRFKNLILIGSSTGGPKALQSVIPKFSKNINAAILIVQHMPAKFTKSLAERLNSESQVKVTEAGNGDILHRGCAYVAPGDFHMRISKEADRTVIKLDQGEKWLGLRPTVDNLFESAKLLSEYNKIAVILTGMGSDGTKGLKVLKPVGCKVVVQDESTSVVFGMPKAAIEAKLVDEVVQLDNITKTVEKYLEV